MEGVRLRLGDADCLPDKAVDINIPLIVETIKKLIWQLVVGKYALGLLGELLGQLPERGQTRRRRLRSTSTDKQHQPTVTMIGDQLSWNVHIANPHIQHATLTCRLTPT